MRKRALRTVNVHEAKTHLSRLLEVVATGEEVVIARAGRPVARLLRIAGSDGDRVMGRDHGAVWIADDFDAPLPGDALEDFER